MPGSCCRFREHYRMWLRLWRGASHSDFSEFSRYACLRRGDSNKFYIIFATSMPAAVASVVESAHIQLSNPQANFLPRQPVGKMNRPLRREPRRRANRKVKRRTIDARNRLQ
eukprot:5072437-Pyramimonas_sp.AAC.1